VKICVLKIGAMGDILMATPLLHTLRSHYPNAQIDCWAGQQFKSVLELNPHVTLRSFDADILYKKQPLKLLGLIRQLRKEEYDKIIMLDRHWVFSLMAKLTGIKERIGFDRHGEGRWYTHRVPYGDRVHEIRQYQRLGKILGCHPTKNTMELHLSVTDEHRAELAIKQFHITNAVAIAPGGAKNPGQDMPSRRWPIERFAMLANTISKKNKVVLVGGKDDKKLGEYISQSIDCVNLIDTLSVRETAGVLKHCKLLITNDAGLMHVAAAVGCKVLAIFGPTDPVRKAPHGSFVAWHPMHLDHAEVFATYDKAAEENIKKVSLKEVLDLWKKA
jgi:lipopolysaccharide heptosyltransferase II